MGQLDADNGVYTRQLNHLEHCRCPACLRTCSRLPYHPSWGCSGVSPQHRSASRAAGVSRKFAPVDRPTCSLKFIVIVRGNES
jgi:hypothetical protein